MTIDIVVVNEFGSHLKVSLNDEGTQTYLYTQTVGNVNDVWLTENYKQLQNQLHSAPTLAPNVDLGPIPTY